MIDKLLEKYMGKSRIEFKQGRFNNQPTDRWAVIINGKLLKKGNAVKTFDSKFSAKTFVKKRHGIPFEEK